MTSIIHQSQSEDGVTLADNL